MGGRYYYNPVTDVSAFFDASGSAEAAQIEAQINALNLPSGGRYVIEDNTVFNADLQNKPITATGITGNSMTSIIGICLVGAALLGAFK